MGNVDLHFQPSVPVFDANVSLGRRHDRRVETDRPEDLLTAMDRAGVGRALVYSPHAAYFDARDGNRLLLELICGEIRLIPQFVVNPAADDFERFATSVKEAGVRSVRLLPKTHRYPFRTWILDTWLEWVTRESLPLWIPVEEVEANDLYETLKTYPEVRVVLCEVHYVHLSWVLPLLRHMSQIDVELSRIVTTDGIPMLLRTVDRQRVLFGSRFPDSPMSPQLYALHRCGLDEGQLLAICGENLDHLLTRASMTTLRVGHGHG